MYTSTGDRDEEEFRRDKRVRLVAELMDPARRRPPVSVSVTPAQIIARAERENTGPRPLRRLAVAGVAAVIVAAIVLVPSLLARRGPTAPPQPPASGPTALYDGDGTQRPAATELRALAEAAEAASPPQAGPVTYSRLQTWSIDLTSSPPAVTVLDERLWRTPEGAGLTVVTALPQWRSFLEATAGDASGLPQTRVTYRPGELAVVVAEPSTDPALLAAQLDEHEPFGNGPQAPLRAVRDLNRHHALDGPHRGAALRVLAETTGILFRGWVRLDGGRDGAVFTADSEEGGVRDVAVFDRAGRLLLYQQVATRKPASSDSVQPFVTYMLAVLVNGTTDQIDSTVVIPS